MKRKILFMPVLCLLALTASAQKQVLTFNKSWKIASPAVTCSGKPVFYTYYWEDDYLEIYDADWKVEKTIPQGSSFAYVNYDVLTSEGTPYVENIHITQNLFNNDDKWEYVECVGGSGDRAAIYNICNEDGIKLFSFNSTGGIDFFKMNGTLYAICGSSKSDIIYEIDTKGGTGVKEVAKFESNMQVVETENNTITIDLGENASGELSVSNVAGQQIANKKVDGERLVNIPVEKLHGTYVISLRDGQRQDSRKFIVK